MKERVRVFGKTSLTRLSMDDAVVALGLEADVLQERIRANSIAHGHDEHGQVYVLVGASSNVPDPDHNRRRMPRDEEIIEGLEAQASNLRSISEPPEEPEEPTEPFEGVH